jgi:hypothetical protein
MNNKIKLVALDLDGTLFDSEKKISKENISAIKRAIDMGVVVLPSTGRPFVGVPQAIRDIAEIKYVITVNGAAVYDLHSGKCIYEDPIPHETMTTLIDDLDALDIMADLFIGGQGYMDSKNRGFLEKTGLSRAVIDYLVSSRLVVDNLPKYVKEEKPVVQKITINFRKGENGTMHHRDKTIEVANKYADKLIMVSGGMSNVELTDKSVSKGNALLKLAEMMGIKREETMACGDSGNDLDMIVKAGIGVAMANSEQAVLDAADYITLSNDENGVAAAINKFIF